MWEGSGKMLDDDQKRFNRFTAIIYITATIGDL